MFKRNIYDKKTRQKRIRAGRCGKCGKYKPAYTCRMCKYCILKEMARRHTGSSKNWYKLLELLKKQKYLCIYSGQRLIVGYNASVDHIIPKKSGGRNEIKNLQWTTMSVNWMKHSLSEKRFLKLIKRIVDYKEL